MNKEDLLQFLIASNKAGYAGGEEKQWINEPDGSTTIPYEQGEWRSHDNFFGGEPYGGRLVVFHENRPVWIMVYYGWVTEGIDPNIIYSVLRGALMNMPEEAPFRGPANYEQDGHHYSNSWTGDIERYTGDEQIEKDGEVVYQAKHMGGLVDNRQGV